MSEIVVGYDGSKQSLLATRWAAAEAASRRQPLLIAHALRGPITDVVATPLVTPLPEIVSDESVRNDAERRLTEVAAECRRDWPGLEVSTKLEFGRAAEVLTGLDGELLVAGASGRSALSRALLGSTSTSLAHHHDRPVVIVRDDRTEGPVVVGVDGSETSSAAIAFAFDFAERHGTGVIAVHAWADLPLDSLAPVRMWDYDWAQTKTQAHAVLTAYLAEHQVAHPNVDVRKVVSFEGPAHALAEEAENAALVVVGSHGRGAMRRALLGSVSHAVLYHAPCSVAVVKAARPG